MLIEVAMLPKMLPTAATEVCIMVDVLRASTTLTVLLERGVAEIRLVHDVDEARRVAATIPSALLGGERGGLPPAGFDFGNSPIAAAQAPVAGRRVVFATSNGTRALAALAAAPVVLVGGLLNARASAATAVRLAEQQATSIRIVCAGRALGEAFGLDDLYAAGAIVEEIRAITGASEIPARQAAAGLISGGATYAGPPALDESALAASRVFAYYADDHLRALAESGNGRALFEIGLAEDVEYCARLNGSQTVGIVRYSDAGMRLERA